MSNIKNKKLILGSVLAGLMVAAPGLSVTTGKFFQTAHLKVGYGLAQAAGQVDDTTTEGDPATRGRKVKVEEEAAPAAPAAPTAPAESQPSETKTDKKKSGDKSCGAGSCGGGK
jgi:hypothetical protein